ncbi:AAA family ATPase [Lentzea albidocapillata]|uniref:AAA family ATPase n=1 Tax=Lentzea albidocapillata TaxID=40571 RepID=UPI000B7E3FC9|nr:AAA family ATPase [Lentzea albidocapillata]
MARGRLVGPFGGGRNRPAKRHDRRIVTYEFDEDRWGLRRIEAPARRIIDAGLGESRSAIEPEVLAWDAPVVVELRRRIVDNADAGRGTFLKKLREQLAGADREVVLLMAELLALHALPLGNLSGAVKTGRVTTVLSWKEPPAVVPEDISLGLEGPGVFHGGVGFNVQIWQQLGWLLSFVEQWHELSPSDRQTALGEPWTFREFVDRQDTGQLAIRNSLLYLAFPDTFLPIARQADKVAIRNAFESEIGGRTGADAVAVDRDLSAIYRAHREQAGGERVHYYSDGWEPKWRKQKRKHTDDSSRAWLVRDPESGQAERISIAADHLGDLDPSVDREQLDAAVEEGYQHLDYAQRRALATDYFHFLSTMKVDDLVAGIADDHVYTGVVTGEPERIGGMLCRAISWSPQSVASVHALPVDLAREFEQQGAVVDITGAFAALTSLAGAPDAPEEVQSVGELSLGAVTSAFAGSLHFDQEWLQKVVSALQDRKQVVLYGPPGTGKTYLARELARHITDPTAIRLVQFHPSYAYEDFFEGFRPRSRGETVSFELVPGPLRRLAAAAEADKGRPYVLIIDEINRANLSKVFGELYFLLEYRDATIDLQYSPGDRFKLPPNVFIVGTMNTADRSIALVDAAMRRRFAFFELHPDHPPVSDLLARWATANAKTDDRAELLVKLNSAIGSDREFKIGPSYLMKPDADRGLELVWEQSILPLLEEHYYETLSRQNVHERFGLDVIRGMQ